MSGHSWLESANDPETDFPLENLPFGVFRLERRESPRIGVAIGDRILDLRGLSRSSMLEGLPKEVTAACEAGQLNDLMALGNAASEAVRLRLHPLLSQDEHRAAVGPLLHPQRDAEMLLPAAIGDYSDFYASIDHARRVGELLRPDQPLFPNYKYVPIGYHGRASSLIIGGTEVHRPCGQAKRSDSAVPVFGPSRRLDYELEVGFYVGPGNTRGRPVPIAQAEDHLFGLCLLNDWSARDMQSWEYQPLGPFLGKSFVTSISPWVVTMAALRPFRVPAKPRPEGDPAPLDYLDAKQDHASGGADLSLIDLTLEVWLETERMRTEQSGAVRLSRGNLRDLYWTPAQMLTHQASNGCLLRPGDLLASGTVSGAELESAGCLLEQTRGGAQPLQLPNGESRSFLEDGDEIVLRGWCERPGVRRIGFGESRGRIIPAPV